MCTVLLPPGVNPIAVNKYFVSMTQYAMDHAVADKVPYVKVWISTGLSCTRVYVYSTTPQIRINSEGEPSGHTANPDNLIFL